MKQIAIVIASLVAAACSSSSGGGTPSLDGTWYYVNASGTAGAGATFKGDGTYLLQELVLTSSSTGNDQMETGTFVDSSGTLTLTPKQWSCPGPDAIYKLSYSFNGGNLVLAQPSGVIIMQPDTQTGSTGAITIGCFDSSGNFKASPLAAVSN
jgi:hypothetical protein